MGNVHILEERTSLIHQFVAELRDVNLQTDAMRFRRNLERVGSIIAYEISKTLATEEVSVETPLGVAITQRFVLQPVLATILRAGLPMHAGMLSMFDSAGSAFISAYRRHHKDGSFEVKLDYISCGNLNGRDLILCDPMLATGASMTLAAKELLKFGEPSSLHIATIIASRDGVEAIQRILPQAHLWTCALDEELTARSYIVPGLGDAGDLAYGAKLQE